MVNNRRFGTGKWKDSGDFFRREATYLLKQAYKAREERRLEDCTGILEMAAERCPQSVEIKELLAQAYIDSGNRNKAVWMWEELSALRPNKIEYTRRLADACFARKWYRKAITQYVQIIQVDPGDVRAWENLMVCYAWASEHNMAARVCINAVDTLKDRGIESAKLYYSAFFYADIACRANSVEYLKRIITMIKKDGRQVKDDYAGIIKELLGYFKFSGKREVLSYIRQMVDMLPNADDYAVADLVYAETKRHPDSVTGRYPALFGKLFRILIEDDESDGAGDDLSALGYSIINKIESYRPHLIRLKTECPGLYALHKEFFDKALSHGNAKPPQQEKTANAG